MALWEFTFDAELTHAFVRFGCECYRDDPNWIPPFAEDIFALLAPDFPFYRQPGNAHRHFLATVGDRVVGRISAMVNRDLQDRDGSPVGCVGFFESIEDDAVAYDLLDTAVGWLHEKHGLARIWGPMNFDIWHGYRFMTRGFGERLFCGEPYNKPYYPDFFARYGFAPKQRWNSVEIRGRQTLERLRMAGACRWQELAPLGYRIEPFDLARFQDESRKLHTILTRSFSGFLGFTPITFSDFERVIAPMQHAVDPCLFLFAYDADGRPCGVAGALLDVSDAVRAMQGRRTLGAQARFLFHRLGVKRVLFHVIGLTPEEVAKRSGLGWALSACVLQGMLDHGYETLLGSLMAEGNASRGLLQDAATDGQREYTLFELNR